MDFKEIKGIKHFLFDDIKEFKVHYPECDIAHNWRHGKQDEWVFTDDEHICQILKRGTIYEKVDQRSKDYLFARYIAKGVLSNEGANPIEAYKKLYPKAEKDTYIQRKSSSLLKKENIRTMVKEEIQNILDEEEATPNWIIGLYKDIASIGERDSDRLRALDS